MVQRRSTSRSAKSKTKTVETGSEKDDEKEGSHMSRSSDDVVKSTNTVDREALIEVSCSSSLNDGGGDSSTDYSCFMQRLISQQKRYSNRLDTKGKESFDDTKEILNMIEMMKEIRYTDIKAKSDLSVALESLIQTVHNQLMTNKRKDQELLHHLLKMSDLALTLLETQRDTKGSKMIESCLGVIRRRYSITKLIVQMKLWTMAEEYIEKITFSVLGIKLNDRNDKHLTILKQLMDKCRSDTHHSDESNPMQVPSSSSLDFYISKFGCSQTTSPSFSSTCRTSLNTNDDMKSEGLQDVFCSVTVGSLLCALMVVNENTHTDGNRRNSVLFCAMILSTKLFDSNDVYNATIQKYSPSITKLLSNICISFATTQALFGFQKEQLNDYGCVSDSSFLVSLLVHQSILWHQVNKDFDALMLFVHRIVGKKLISNKNSGLRVGNQLLRMLLLSEDTAFPECKVTDHHRNIVIEAILYYVVRRCAGCTCSQARSVFNTIQETFFKKYRNVFVHQHIYLSAVLFSILNKCKQGTEFYEWRSLLQRYLQLMEADFIDNEENRNCEIIDLHDLNWKKSFALEALRSNIAESIDGIFDVDVDIKEKLSVFLGKSSNATRSLLTSLDVLVDCCQECFHGKSTIDDSAVNSESLLFRSAISAVMMTYRIKYAFQLTSRIHIQSLMKTNKVLLTIISNFKVHSETMKDGNLDMMRWAASFLLGFCKKIAGQDLMYQLCALSACINIIQVSLSISGNNHSFAKALLECILIYNRILAKEEAVNVERQEKWEISSLIRSAIKTFYSYKEHDPKLLYRMVYEFVELETLDSANASDSGEKPTSFQVCNLEYIDLIMLEIDIRFAMVQTLKQKNESDSIFFHQFRLVDSLCEVISYLSQSGSPMRPTELCQCYLLASSVVHIFGIGCQKFGPLASDDQSASPLSLKLAKLATSTIDNTISNLQIDEQCQISQPVQLTLICSNLFLLSTSLEQGLNKDFISEHFKSTLDAVKSYSRVYIGLEHSDDEGHIYMCANILGVAFLCFINCFFDESMVLFNESLILMQKVKLKLLVNPFLRDWICSAVVFFLSQQRQAETTRSIQEDDNATILYGDCYLQKCVCLFKSNKIESIKSGAADLIRILEGECSQSLAPMRRTRSTLNLLLASAERWNSCPLSSCVYHANEALRLSRQCSSIENIKMAAENFQFSSSHYIFSPILRWQYVACHFACLLLKSDLSIHCGLPREAAKLAKEASSLSQCSSSSWYFRESKLRMAVSQLSFTTPVQANETFQEVKSNSVIDKYESNSVDTFLKVWEKLVAVDIHASSIPSCDIEERNVNFPGGFDEVLELKDVRILVKKLLDSKTKFYSSIPLTDGLAFFARMYAHASLSLERAMSQHEHTREESKEILNETLDVLQHHNLDECNAIRALVTMKSLSQYPMQSEQLIPLFGALNLAANRPCMRAMLSYNLGRLLRDLCRQGHAEYYCTAAYMQLSSIGNCFDVQQAVAFLEKIAVIEKRRDINNASFDIVKEALSDSIEQLSTKPVGSVEEVQNRFSEMIGNLPSDVTMISISLLMDEIKQELAGNLVANGFVITRITKDRKPLWYEFQINLVVPGRVEALDMPDNRLHLDQEQKFDLSIMEFLNIIHDSGVSMKGDLIKAADSDPNARRKWWNERLALDERLADTLSSIQKNWFGVLRILLLPALENEEVRALAWTLAKELAEEICTTSSSQFLREGLSTDIELLASWLDLFINGSSELNGEEMTECLTLILGNMTAVEGSVNDYFVDLSNRVSMAYKDVARGVRGSSNDSDAGNDSKTVGRGKRSTRRSKLASSKSKTSIATARQQISNTSSRGAVILILGDSGCLHKLPFESLPILRSYQVCRMPSITSALSLVSLRNCTSLSKCIDTSHCSTVNVNARLAYYLLNPSSDLKHTQSVFEPIFTSHPLNWSGDAGKAPKCEEILKRLIGKQLFIYMGHGAGELYLSPRALQMMMLLDDENKPPVDGSVVSHTDISNHSDICILANLLMGCSSGALSQTSEPYLESPSGTVLSYIMSGSSMTCGNLWDVTDKDIDRFSKSLLDKWLLIEQMAKKPGNVTGMIHTKTSSDPVCMGTAISACRRTCKLPYLNGAAPVCYGLPTCISL